jgi:hypothetical protein
MKFLAALVLGILITGSAAAGSNGADRWDKWEHSDRWGDAGTGAASMEVDGVNYPDTHANVDGRNAQWEAYRARLAAKIVKMNGKPGKRLGQRALHPDLNSGVCDELADATDGLQELCVAFCELQDCSPDFTLENPYENCSASSVEALAAYESKRGAGDPDMPCVKQPDTSMECPCWTVNELTELRDPLATDTFAVCFTNASSDGRFSNLDTWHLSGPGYETTVSTTEWSGVDGGAATCLVTDRCEGGDCLNESRNLVVTPEQFAACEANLAMSAQNRGLECTDLGL